MALIQKQPLKPEDQTIGSIGNVSEIVITLLVNEFAEEFQAFSKKKCLKKKKRLPGIKINVQTIEDYIVNFQNFLNKEYDKYLKASFQKITPLKFLKACRIEPEDSIFELMSEENEDDSNWDMYPGSAFF